MPFPKRNSPSRGSPSFALISVLALVSLAALTATAFLASARLERQATSSIGNSTRLEMALDSGKICAMQVINDNSQPDVGGNTHIVTYWRTNWADELGYPFIGQIKTSGTPGQQSAIWYYFPLFSPAGVTNLDTTVYQTAMRFTNTHQGTFSNDMQTYMSINATKGFVANPGLTNDKCVQIPLLGGRTSPPVGWVYMNQEKRKPGSNLTNISPVVRLAWFTEDLEGLIDAERMGASANRSTGTNSEEISLASAIGTNGSPLISAVSTFTNKRKAYFSYGLLASSNVSGLANPTNARYFATGLRAWAPTNPASPTNGAPAWIPAGIPIGGSATAPTGYANQGYTKLNLNNLATNSGTDPVATIAQVITSNLSTNFLARAGGLTNNSRFDYAKCIAANIVDYIDSNQSPTIQTGNNGYRGCEALPLVSEVAMSIQWTNQVKTGVRYEEEFEVVHVVEFWNMFNKPFNGTVNFGYNSTLEAQVGLTKFALNNTSLMTSGQLTNSYSLSLQPNEFRAYASPPIRYKVLSGVITEPDYGGKKATNGGYITFGRPGSPSANNYTSSWTLSSGGTIYDQTTSIEEPTFTVRCEKYVTGTDKNPDFKNHQPSLRLDPPNKIGEVRFGTGDLRITFFSTNAYSPNDHGIFNASTFADSASLGYRNTIWAYTDRKGSTSQPSVWLDGGHSTSPQGPGKVPGNDIRVYTAGTVTVNPAFASALASHVPTVAVQNAAPAYIADAPMTNICELGRIFDPMQWQTAISMTPSTPQAVNPTNITSSSLPDYQQGGGNTLRIGRAEHQRFAFTNMYGNSSPWIPNMAQSSASLLDLFCVLTNAKNTTDIAGPYSLGGGKINLNTAPAPVLRALAGGVLLTNDPAQTPANYSIPPAMAEAFAQGVMRFRSKYPFLTPSHLCFIGTDPSWPNTNTWPSNAVFGNTNTITLSVTNGNTFSTAQMSVTEWSDQAAEEWFSKIYSLSSCQSHNYRIYVVAQLVTTNSAGATNALGPLMKKYYQVYARNGSSVTPLTNVTTYPNNTIYSWKPTIGTIDISKSPY